MTGKLTDKARLDLVRDIVQSQLPASQKLLSIGVAVLSDDTGAVTLGAEAMKRITSTSKRDTVFDAKRALAEDGLKIIATVSEPGKANSYRIMPPHVVAEIVAAYERRQPVPKKGTSPVPQNGTSTRPPDRDVTHPELVDVTRPLGGTSPVPQNGTGLTPRALAPAQKELPSEVVIYQGDTPPLSPMPTFGYDDRVLVENGRLVLVNGLRQYWLDKFGGDAERLDLALIQAAAYVQQNSRKPLEAQVSAQLARACAEKIDRDKRYADASQRNGRRADGRSAEGEAQRRMRILSQLTGDRQ